VTLTNIIHQKTYYRLCLTAAGLIGLCPNIFLEQHPERYVKSGSCPANLRIAEIPTENYFGSVSKFGPVHFYPAVTVLLEYLVTVISHHCFITQ